MKPTERYIVERYARDLHEFVSRTVVCREDAEEVVQDTLLRALRSLGTFDERRATLRTWLWRIAWHEVVRYMERKNRRPRLVEVDEGMMVAEAEEGEDERLTLLERAILRLGEEEQMLLQLRYTDGLSLKEIAYVTDAKATTLAVRLQRIRERLRDIMNKMKAE
ncbi:MAG: sigma-70 family RNA polymerase sigma factor [Bacteroidaceae bacterium]|nr:sigma-70 family RNA polymerase sigma factor [Bacteroidaceae bacterium]